MNSIVDCPSRLSKYKARTGMLSISDGVANEYISSRKLKKEVEKVLKEKIWQVDQRIGTAYDLKDLKTVKEWLNLASSTQFDNRLTVVENIRFKLSYGEKEKRLFDIVFNIK